MAPNNGAFFCILACFALFNHGLCDYCCEYFNYFSWNFGPTLNISLTGSACPYIEAFHIFCNNFEVYWEIVRADAETEKYTVAIQSYYRTYENHQDRGLSFEGFCDIYCFQLLTITPTDMRYNGAQITGVINIPECYNTSNATNITTIRMQGLLEAPTDVEYDIVSVDNVAVSWRPPFTLEGVPILHYTVYITSQGLSEQRNTTETNITLERPRASTTYQISAWNEVGEGNASREAFLTIIEATVKVISELSKPGICLTCTLYADSTADGCAVRMENNKHVFVFSATRKNDSEDKPVLQEFFPVPEAGEYSASVHEIHYGVVQEYVSTNVTVSLEKSHGLIYSSVKPESEGICAFCAFTNGSNAEGCTIRLSNHLITYEFNISRQPTNDMALLECFKVPHSGSYHVLVGEILIDEECYNTLELPSITVPPSDKKGNGTLNHRMTNNTEISQNGTNGKPTVTGLSIALGLTLLIIPTLLAFNLYLNRKKGSKRNSDSESRVQPAAVTTTPLYENTILHLQPTSGADGGDNSMYEQVELRPITGQEKEIDVDPNAAYVTVRRQI